MTANSSRPGRGRDSSTTGRERGSAPDDRGASRAPSTASAPSSKVPHWLAVVRHLTRLDARSLGLFRIALGFVLIADLVYRYRWVVEFYSNEGVLPNHTHLNGLRQNALSVWSAFHAFNSAGEARFGMGVVLLIYVCFLLGFRTRAVHILSLVAYLSLGTRNLLTESWGNWIGVSVLAFSVALPLGSRFGIDAFVKASREATEVDADDLNHRSSATPLDVDRHRAPGWSPLSLAAVGFLLQLVVVYVCLATNQADAWKDGTALDKFLHIPFVASPAGFLDAASHPPILATIAKILYWSQLAIPALLFVPLLRGTTRLLAAIAMLAHGVFLGVFFNLGAFGWVLAACSFAVLSSDMWDAWTTKHVPSRMRTVIYDADCGICFWLAKLLKRLDGGRHLTFQGNDTLFVAATADEADERADGDDAAVENPFVGGTYRIVSPAGTQTTKPVSASVTPELVERTIVVIDSNGGVHTNGSAIVAILQALPGFRILAAIAPVFLLDWLYGIIAPRRTRISVACGLDACGTVRKPAHHVADPLVQPVAPSARLRRRFTSAVREGYAALILAAMLVSTSAENPKFPVRLPANETLQSVAWYTRMIERWDVLAAVPDREGIFVVDGVTADDSVVDTFTGKAPVVDFNQPFQLGQMWSDYLYQITQNPKFQEPKWRGYLGALNTYLQKPGPRWKTEVKEKKVTSLDAYWFSTTVPPGEVTPQRIHRIGKGGTVLADTLPTPTRQQPLPQPQNPMPFPGGAPMLRPRAPAE